MYSSSVFVDIIYKLMYINSWLTIMIFGSREFMNMINNELLLEAYWTAIQLNLDKEFVSILEKEIVKRNIKDDITFIKSELVKN